MTEGGEEEEFCWVFFFLGNGKWDCEKETVLAVRQEKLLDL